MNQKTCGFLCPESGAFPFGRCGTDARCVLVKTRLRSELGDMVHTHGVRRFLVTLERGSSTWAAEMVLELKKGTDLMLEWDMQLDLLNCITAPFLCKKLWTERWKLS